MSENSSAVTKNKGGRPKTPLSISKQLKSYGNLFEKSLEELRALGDKITDKTSIQEILGFLEQSETVTQQVFKTSKVRFLQRGMLLTELKNAFDRDPSENLVRSWCLFYEHDVQRFTNIGKKTEELCRGIWEAWLLASENGADPRTLLDEPGNIHDFKKSLQRLADGESSTPEPKPQPTPHDKIRKVRDSVRRQISATKVGITPDDEQYEKLVLAVQAALKNLDDYVASYRPSEAVLDVSQDDAGDVPFDGTEALEDALAVELEAAA